LVKKIFVLNNLFDEDSKGNMNFFSRKFDGFAKSPPLRRGIKNWSAPSAALRCILSHCGVQVSTPHSVGFAHLASEAFYCAVWFSTFYGFIKFYGKKSNNLFEKIWWF